MGSDRVIRRDEGERLARVSDGFAATRHPVTVFFSLSHSPQFTPLPSGVRCSLHGDERQDGSQRGAGLHCRGKVRDPSSLLLGVLSFYSCVMQMVFWNYFNLLNHLWHDSMSTNGTFLFLYDIKTFHAASVYYRRLHSSTLLRLKPFILQPGLFKKIINPCVFFVLTVPQLLCPPGTWSIAPSSIPMSPRSRFMNTLRPRKRSRAAAAISKTPPPICPPTTDCRETHQELSWVGGRAVKFLQHPGYDAVAHSQRRAKSRSMELEERRLDSTTNSEKNVCLCKWTNCIIVRNWTFYLKKSCLQNVKKRGEYIYSIFALGRIVCASETATKTSVVPVVWCVLNCILLY